MVRIHKRKFSYTHLCYISRTSLYWFKEYRDCVVLRRKTHCTDHRLHKIGHKMLHTNNIQIKKIKSNSIKFKRQKTKINNNLTYYKAVVALHKLTIINYDKLQLEKILNKYNSAVK